MNKGFTIPVLDHGYVRYIDHLGTDQRVVEAARISYMSPSKGPEADKKLLFYLVCQSGFLNRAGLQLRGKRNKNNSRTRKGKRKTVANKKKATK